MQFYIIDLHERLFALIFNFRKEYFTNLCKSLNDKKLIFCSNLTHAELSTKSVFITSNKSLTRAEAIIQHKFFTKKCISMCLITNFGATILWKNIICLLNSVLSPLKDVTLSMSWDFHLEAGIQNFLCIITYQFWRFMGVKRNTQHPEFDHLVRSCFVSLFLP